MEIFLVIKRRFSFFFLFELFLFSFLSLLFFLKNSKKLKIVKKIIEVDDHIGIAISGLTSDARVLSRYMRNECLNHRFVFDTPMITGRLVRQVADSFVFFVSFFLFSFCKSARGEKGRERGESVREKKKEKRDEDTEILSSVPLRISDPHPTSWSPTLWSGFACYWI